MLISLATLMTVGTVPEALAACEIGLRTWIQDQVAAFSDASDAAVICYTDGSYREAGPSNTCQIGWACVFFASDNMRGASSCAFLGAASGGVPSWADRLGDAPSAYAAECLALAFGAWISARNFPGLSTAFVSDCTAGLGAATGSTGFRPDGPAGNAYGLHLLRGASSPGVLDYRYVPGHSKILGNEVADQLAKAAAKGVVLGVCELELADCWLKEGGPFLPWFACACRMLRGDPAWPSVHSEQALYSRPIACTPEQVLQPFLPPQRPFNHSPAPSGDPQEPSLGSVASRNSA